CNRRAGVELPVQVVSARSSQGSQGLFIDFRFYFAYRPEGLRPGSDNPVFRGEGARSVFAHLHVHSNFSFCRGADRIESLVVAARQRGMDALALTDTNGLYGLVWFLGAARAAGLRPIVGAEAHFGNERAVVLVKDREGYAGLCRLLTRIHRALNVPV